jgi:hypothetical protein
MPLIKRRQKAYGLHNVIFGETQVKLTNAGIPIPAVLQSLVRVACYPNESRWQSDIAAADEFTRTSRALAYLIIAFVTERSQEYKKRSPVVAFLMNHNCLVLKKGEFHLINDPSLTPKDLVRGTRKDKGIFMVEDLTDGDLAQFLKVSLSTVKSARARYLKDLEKI